MSAGSDGKSLSLTAIKHPRRGLTSPRDGGLGSKKLSDGEERKSLDASTNSEKRVRLTADATFLFLSTGSVTIRGLLGKRALSSSSVKVPVMSIALPGLHPDPSLRSSRKPLNLRTSSSVR